MHNSLRRALTLASYTLTILMILGFCYFLTTGFLNYSTPVKIHGKSILVMKHKQIMDADREIEKELDMGYFVFDLKVDLTPLFNWNVKQLFIYVTAEYKTEGNALNQIIVWDKIIMRGEKAALDLRNVKPKYVLWDEANGLIGNKNVTLSLYYDVIPNTGAFTRIVADGFSRFGFTDHYFVTSRRKY